MNHVVLFILSKNGSLEFKQGIEDAENMVRNQSVDLDDLNDIHDRLFDQLKLLEREIDNPAYSKHQRGVMETYRDKLYGVIRLLQDYINEVMSYEEQEEQEEEEEQEEHDDARGFKRKSVRRRTGRRRTGRRRKSIRKSRKSRRKSRKRKY
jgi:hypothetical protein